MVEFDIGVFNDSFAFGGGFWTLLNLKTEKARYNVPFFGKSNNSYFVGFRLY